MSVLTEAEKKKIGAVVAGAVVIDCDTGRLQRIDVDAVVAVVDEMVSLRHDETLAERHDAARLVEAVGGWLTEENVVTVDGAVAVIETLGRKLEVLARNADPTARDALDAAHRENAALREVLRKVVKMADEARHRLAAKEGRAEILTVAVFPEVRAALASPAPGADLVPRGEVERLRADMASAHTAVGRLIDNGFVHGGGCAAAKSLVFDAETDSETCDCGARDAWEMALEAEAYLREHARPTSPSSAGGSAPGEGSPTPAASSSNLIAAVERLIAAATAMDSYVDDDDTPEEEKDATITTIADENRLALAQARAAIALAKGGA